ncbi:MAG: 50S ribosomal protein L1 [bacterium]|nr:50S ribosomal protein L1 [bacterium]
MPTKPIAKPKAGPKSKTASVKATKAAASSKIKGTPKLPHSKKWRDASAKLVKNQLYSLADAVKLAKETVVTKFTPSVELHVHVTHEARGTLQLPHQTGKTVRVAVATDAVIEEIAAGKINFDVLIAEPTQMAKLAQHAKTLGPKGLMPNPKSGTVTTDVAKVKQELEAGKSEYRTDAGKNIHLTVGKADTADQMIIDNLDVALKAIMAYKIKTATLTTTMGPGLKLALPDA